MKKIAKRMMLGCLAAACMVGIGAQGIASAATKEAPGVKYVSKTTAKRAARAHAGIDSTKIIYIRSELKHVNGSAQYEVDFYSKNKEYDYTVDAVTGKVTNYDNDIENFTIPASSVTLEEAKKTARKNAGVSASGAIYTRAELISQEANATFLIEFFTGKYEYLYEIDAFTGKIIDSDKSLRTGNGGDVTVPETGDFITEAEAKAIVLDHANKKESDVTFVKIYLDLEDMYDDYDDDDYDDDDDVAQYEIEFYHNNVEYDYEIDAITGKILSVDDDADDFDIPVINDGNYISEAKVKEIVLKHAGLAASEVGGFKAELDRDDNRMEYEIDFRKGQMEYEYTVDASTGKILSFDSEYDD